MCEADEIYVAAGEKGIENEDESPRKRRLKKGRASFESDKPPVVTLVLAPTDELSFWFERISRT
ncbi:hypothetical protein JCM18750_33460 [Halostagnicola bangensis]